MKNVAEVYIYPKGKLRGDYISANTLYKFKCRKKFKV